MAQKKTNIKIKHRKFNLYNKKKSKARQALAVILTIVAACALGIVGYGIGKPVLDYFQNRGQYTSDPSDSSYMSGTPSDASGGGSDGREISDSSAESPSDTSDVTEPRKDTVMYFLPEDAAANSASLNSALAAAKSAGHTTVVVTLKDTLGNFLYKSEIAEIKDGDSIQGTLTAAQIADIITKAGLTPAARINTLMDRLNPYNVNAGFKLTTGGTWLDNRPDNGGKPWLSPFNNNTTTFMRNITNELSAAGFEYIICANTRYPAFHNVDITTYLNDLPLTDMTKRSAALWSVLDAVDAAASGKGAQMWIEISSASLLAENKSCTDAEITSDKARIGASRIIIDYTAPAASAPASTSSTVSASSSSSLSASSTATTTTTAPASASSTTVSSSSTTPVSAAPVSTSGSVNSTPAAAVTPEASVSAPSSSPPVSSTSVTDTRSAAAVSVYRTAKDFAVKAKAELGGAEFAVRIRGFSGSALADVQRAFAEEDIPVFE